MKNYISSGCLLTVTAPYDVLSGQALQVGTLWGVATRDAVSGAQVEIQTIGVMDVTKLSSDNPTQGQNLYWDNSNKRLTVTNTSNLYVGKCVVVPAGSATSVIGSFNGLLSKATG
jgi:predicted RecA/RadA family phage recombinase